VLDHGRHRWPRQELQPHPATRWTLSTHATVRHSFHLADPGPWRKPDGPAQGAAGHGGGKRQPPLPDPRHPPLALDRHGRKPGLGDRTAEMIEELIARTPHVL